MDARRIGSSVQSHRVHTFSMRLNFKLNDCHDKRWDHCFFTQSNTPPSEFTSPKRLQHFGAFACWNCYRHENKYVWLSCRTTWAQFNSHQQKTQPEAIQTRISLSQHTNRTHNDTNNVCNAVTIFYFGVWSLFPLFLLWNVCGIHTTRSNSLRFLLQPQN